MTTDQLTQAAPRRRVTGIDDLSWPALIRVAVCRGVLCMLLTLIAFAFVPRLFGLVGTTIVSGSMRPAIQRGDVVLVSDVDEFSVGQVILFPNPAQSDQRLLHRIVEIRDDGLLVTQGDANEDVDSTPVDPATVIGVGRILIPLIGLPVVWADQGRIVLVAAAVIFGVLLARGTAAIEFFPSGRHGAKARPILDGLMMLGIFAVAVLLVFLGAARTSAAGFTSGTDTTASWATGSSSEAPTCSIVTWMLNSWGVEGIVDFDVRNNTAVAVPAYPVPWKLTWTFQGDEQALRAHSGASVSQAGRVVTFTSAEWMTIQPAGVIRGQVAVGSPTSTYLPPVGFALNGKPCDFLPTAFTQAIIPPPSSTADPEVVPVPTVTTAPSAVPAPTSTNLP